MEEKKSFICNQCEVGFVKKWNLIRHIRTVHKKKIFSCETCEASFTRMDNLKQHLLKEHSTLYDCQVCHKNFSKKKNLLKHLEVHRLGEHEDVSNQLGDGVSEDMENIDVNEPCNEDKLCNLSSALNSAVKTYTFKKQEFGRDILLFLTEHQEDIKRLLFKNLSLSRGVKWYVALFVEFTRESGGEEISTSPCFRSKCEVLLQESEFDTQFNDVFLTINKACTNFQKEGSNWNIKHIYHMELKIAKYSPLTGSSYIPLPRMLQLKKAIINIKNNDNKCFLWSILAHLYPQAKHAQRVEKYKSVECRLNMNGIGYPVEISKIDIFEKNNNISVNVFGFEGEIFPLRITKLENRDHVNLLYLKSDETSHYCLIKNLNRLLGYLSKHKRQLFYCNLCLHRFSSKPLLKQHHTYCREHSPQKIKMPCNNNIMKFRNYHFTQKVPFVIYADFECFSTKISGCSPNDNSSYTTKLTLHEPSGFSYVIVDAEGSCLKPPVVYSGEDVIDKFLQFLLVEEEHLQSKLKCIKPLVMTVEDESLFSSVENCCICGECLGDDRVRDHDHITGNFRGAAHNKCNINLKQVTYIPVVFHNLRNYDSHLIMQHIGKIKNRKITCIPNNVEKYISFTLGSLRFIDSFQFLGASLETLVKNLLEYGRENFKIMNQTFASDKVLLLLRKGVFPYDYVDSPLKLLETSLPPQSAFFNILEGTSVSEADYMHAQRVWETFKLTSLRQYQDLYVKTDVLLLADVFENFRSLCLENYGLDSAHLYTAPGLAWESCLKMTKIELELFTDPDMYLFMENGIRGGVSMISTRFSEANNKYMTEYNPNIPSKYIMYLDCNNLYGVAMSQCLPVSDFRWLSEEEIREIEIRNIHNDSDTGFILEVDLEYPKELHNSHNDLPVAPEKISVTDEMLSTYSKLLGKELRLSTSSNVKKLIPNLCDKTSYIIHYVNLKQYLSFGLKLKKVHRILAFTQRTWLKPFIDFNTSKRMLAKNNFEKDFFKLLNNAIYGKSMENIRKRINVELVHNEKRAKKLIASPAFESFKIFSHDLIAIHSKKPCLELNRPMYAGFAILELSKTVLYDFHYNYACKKYGERLKLLFTDTDSLCYEIETDDVYKDMLIDANYFDTSNYPRDHFLHSDVNKKVVGKFKDECDGAVIKEFIGLRPKMYSLLEDNGKVKKTGKGIVKRTLKKFIKHTDYKKCLLSRQVQNAKMFSIRSIHHELFTLEQRKETLSPYDDKKYIRDDGINTYAYGHYKIEQ